MNDTPRFSIIIPTFNRCDVVEETLRRLEHQDYPNDAYEVIVVDNSTDETATMVRRVAASSEVSIILLEIPERLPAVKRNRGLQRASGDYVLFMNDDVWFERNVLQEHARAHARAARPIAVLGHIDQSPQMDQTPFVQFFEPFAYHEIEHRSGETVQYQYCWSMHLSLPRPVMIERNLVFHEDWRHIGQEDVELGWRWTEAGYDIEYHPSARSEHFHPHSLTSACRVQESIGRGLRDFESLVDDPSILERYGIFSWRNSPRAIVRGSIRSALFNRLTVPYAQRWLESRTHNSAVTRWMYWKVLLAYTQRGYRSETPRSVRRTLTTPRASVVSQ